MWALAYLHPASHSLPGQVRRGSSRPVSSMLVRLDRELRSQELATDGQGFFFTVTERMSDIWSMELRTVRWRLPAGSTPLDPHT